MAAIVRSPFIDFKTSILACQSLNVCEDCWECGFPNDGCPGRIRNAEERLNRLKEETNLLRTFQSQVDLGLGFLSLIGID
eukprot:scaffold556_cov117-Skeletonema_dohrnii-CCMP3373.AAC.4